MARYRLCFKATRSAVFYHDASVPCCWICAQPHCYLNFLLPLSFDIEPIPQFPSDQHHRDVTGRRLSSRHQPSSWSSSAVVSSGLFPNLWLTLTTTLTGSEFAVLCHWSGNPVESAAAAAISIRRMWLDPLSRFRYREVQNVAIEQGVGR
ncbi:hypothetical protein AAHA92_21746 [Salvia divinorum]|uniref:Uncharacterized protein n=1 Tax=Salvia divinorum TaxID=28513 RepID=A0ABD1GLF1_SALDI